MKNVMKKLLFLCLVFIMTTGFLGINLTMKSKIEESIVEQGVIHFNMGPLVNCTVPIGTLFSDKFKDEVDKVVITGEESDGRYNFTAEGVFMQSTHCSCVRDGGGTSTWNVGGRQFIITGTAGSDGWVQDYSKVKVKSWDKMENSSECMDKDNWYGNSSKSRAANTPTPNPAVQKINQQLSVERWKTILQGVMNDKGSQSVADAMTGWLIARTEILGVYVKNGNMEEANMYGVESWVVAKYIIRIHPQGSYELSKAADKMLDSLHSKNITDNDLRTVSNNFEQARVSVGMP